MVKPAEQLPVVAIDQLRPGVHIRLDLPWLEHPFWFNSFTIRDETQLAALKELGLSEVCWDPRKSRVMPLPKRSSSAPTTGKCADERGAAAQRAAIRAEKRRRHEQILALRRILARCQEQYQQSAQQTQAALVAIGRGHPDGVALAHRVAAQAAERFSAQAEVVLQLIAEHAHDEGATGHALNVMVVAQMLAHRMGMATEMIEAVGTAALLHDIGKTRIPTSVLYNPNRNRNEEELYRLHPIYGAELLAAVPGVSEAVRQWVRAHHERVDGRGFPDQLAGEAVPLAAQIIGLANRFDNLCNPLPGVRALPPAKAVAWLYRHEQQGWEGRLFSTFVKMIGVYPPGTFVQLSNEMIGMVVRTNPKAPLQPWVLVYEPNTPRSELVAIDLAEVTEVTIEKVLAPEQLPAEVVEVLDPRCRVRYFHDTVTPSTRGK